jgi:hypothetical protein
MRRIQPKIERAREIAQKRMAPEASIRKRAFIQARQLVRRRVAGERGAEYEKLGPSEKMAIDRAVEGKQKIIKAIALRLIPRVKRAEAIRLSSFMKGQTLQNQGQPEGKSKESSGSSSVKENLNALFSEAFPQADTDTVNMKAGAKFASNDKKIDTKDKSKNSAIIQYSKFQEEVDYVTPAFTSLCKKSEKSGIDLDVLGEVYDRGWNTWTEDCSVSQQQYAFARVNSFINQGKTYFNEDSDLQELSKGKIADYLDKSQSGRQHPTPEKFRRSAKMATIAAKKSGKRFPGSGQVSVKVKATNEDTLNEGDISFKEKYDDHYKDGRTMIHVHHKGKHVATVQMSITGDSGHPERHIIIAPNRKDIHSDDRFNTPYPDEFKKKTLFGKVKPGQENMKYSLGFNSRRAALRHVKNVYSGKVNEDTLSEARPVNNPAYDHSEKMWNQGKNQFDAKLDTKGRYTKNTVRKMFGKLSPDAESIKEAREPGKPSITRYKRPDGTTALKSLNKWGKRKDWQDTEGGLKKAREHSKSDLSEVRGTPALNCGCGKDPCVTYGPQQEAKGKHKKTESTITEHDGLNRSERLAVHRRLKRQHSSAGDARLTKMYDRKINADLGEEFKNWDFEMKPGDKTKVLRGDHKGRRAVVVAKHNNGESYTVRHADGSTMKHHISTLDRPVSEGLDEKRGLWDNIHAKRKRIKAGSGERMRKPGTEGAPTDQDFKNAQESVSEGLWANINAKRKRIKTGSNERMRPPGTIPAHVFKDASGTGPMKESYESKNSKIRKKIETVDRAPPHTEHSKQAQIQKKIIDEEGNSQPDPKKRLIGTDTLVKALKKDTPGEGKNINEAFAMTFSEATRKTTPSIRNTKKLIQRLHDKEQGQTYAGAPYSSHPKAVMRLGIKVFGGDRFGQQARKAALLHDTIEDTPASPATLLKRGYHPDVVNAVSLLSKDKTKSYEENIAHIASGNTPAHKIAQMVKYVDNMSNYMAPPKPEWEQKRVEKQKDKYMQSMKKLGGVLGVDHHENLQPSWKSKGEGKNINEAFSIAFASGVGVTLTAADLGIRAQGGFELHPSVIKQMEDMGEEVRSSDTEGVVVHTPSGKTIVRKQKVNHKIIGTGNLTDGKPDDTV